MTEDSRSPRRPPPGDEDQRRTSEWSRMTQLVFELLGYLAVLGYLGWLVDQRYNWNGRGLFGGLMLGLVAWIYRVLRVTREMFK